MESVYIRELKYYSKEYIENLLGNDEKLLNTLLKYEIVSFNEGSYQFSYVGVIILDNVVLNIYPNTLKTKITLKRTLSKHCKL